MSMYQQELVIIPKDDLLELLWKMTRGATLMVFLEPGNKGEADRMEL
eukprot:gene12658-9053_t